MRLDDLRKLATGAVLFNLDRIIAPRIVKVLYLLGLAGLLVWAVRHFFESFRWGFGSGLWGILEIGVFGLLGFVVLRVVCEGVLVYFRAHEEEVERAVAPGSGSLLDDVRDAIEELAGEEPDVDYDDPAAAAAANPGTIADRATEYDLPDDIPAAEPRKPSIEPGQNYG